MPRPPFPVDTVGASRSVRSVCDDGQLNQFVMGVLICICCVHHRGFCFQHFGLVFSCVCVFTAMKMMLMGTVVEISVRQSILGVSICQHVHKRG